MFTTLLSNISLTKVQCTMRLDELESEVADVGAMQHQASVLTLLSIREVLSINSVLSIRAILSNKAQLNHAASDISICWVGPTGPVTGPLLNEPLVVVVLAMEKGSTWISYA